MRVSRSAASRLVGAFIRGPAIALARVVLTTSRALPMCVAIDASAIRAQVFAVAFTDALTEGFEKVASLLILGRPPRARTCEAGHTAGCGKSRAVAPPAVCCRRGRSA